MKHEHRFVTEYHGPIGIAAPMDAADFFCIECGDELWSCECNSLRPYVGSDPSEYRNKENAR